MSTVKIYIDEQEFEFDRFRSINPLESFADYAVVNMVPLYDGPLIYAVTSHCLLSGFPVSTLVPEEIEQMIRQAVLANKFDKFDAVLGISESDHANVFEVIHDHITSRIIESSKRAPSISYSNNRLALAYQPWKRQLSILLSTLLYDAGMFRNKSMAYEDRYERILATIALAKLIEDLDSSQLIDDLHSALIELDAKYAITQLAFIRREAETLESLREMEMPDFSAILTFVLKLIEYRDRTDVIQDIDGTVLWSRTVYADRTFIGLNREDYSNIFKAVSDDTNKRYTDRDIHGVREAKPRGRPAKPVSPDVAAKKAAKAANIDSFMDILDTVFKGL